MRGSVSNALAAPEGDPDRELNARPRHAGMTAGDPSHGRDAASTNAALLRRHGRCLRPGEVMT